MAVPVSGKSNETACYNYLSGTLGFNKAATIGILANISKESSFNTGAHGDSGTSYGLCQWHKTRKTELMNWCSQNNLDYTTLQGQLAYLNYELSSGRNVSGGKGLYNTLHYLEETADGAYLAAYEFCLKFERPAGGESSARSRGTLAQTYWSAYVGVSSGGAPSGAAPVNRGQAVVDEARKYLGMHYEWGGEDPSTSFDCSGLAWYAYKYGGQYDWGRTNAFGQYNHCVSRGRRVSLDQLAPGDLVFFAGGDRYVGNPNITHVGIATGNGTEMINAQSAGIKYSDILSWSRPAFYDAYRLFSDSETIVPTGGSGVGIPGMVGGVNNSATVAGLARLAMIDPYEATIKANLSRVEAAGFDYGYLIDMDHGGEFKFYIPEFQESAGAKWSSVSIPGRSVSVLSYDSTESRSITIALDLYAGVGLYKVEPGSEGIDIVGKMHEDANFLKSLEYPDYSNAIVRPPAVVHLILGSAINIAGVVSGVSIEHMKPLDENNRSMYLKVSFTVTQTAVNPPDYSDIAKGVTALISTGNFARILPLPGDVSRGITLDR